MSKDSQHLLKFLFYTQTWIRIIQYQKLWLQHE